MDTSLAISAQKPSKSMTSALHLATGAKSAGWCDQALWLSRWLSRWLWLWLWLRPSRRELPLLQVAS